MSRSLRCVLLIDDSASDIFFHEITIRETNRVETIVSFRDARDALRALREGELLPELILLDVHMPYMDGWEFLDEYELLDEEIRKAIVIMMLTASPRQSERESAMRRSSLAGFEYKPLTAERFEAILREHFDADRAGSAGAP